MKATVEPECAFAPRGHAKQQSSELRHVFQCKHLPHLEENHGSLLPVSTHGFFFKLGAKVHVHAVVFEVLARGSHRVHGVGDLPSKVPSRDLPTTTTCVSIILRGLSRFVFISQKTVSSINCTSSNSSTPWESWILSGNKSGVYTVYCAVHGDDRCTQSLPSHSP